MKEEEKVYACCSCEMEVGEEQCRDQREEHLEDLDIDGRVMLKSLLKKQD